MARKPVHFNYGLASAKPTLTVAELYFATDTFTLYVGNPDGTELVLLLSSNYVTNALYDAHSILAATADNTPAAVTVAANSVVGRAAGNIDDIAISASQIVGRDASSALKGLSTAEMDTLLGYIKKSLVTAKGDIMVASASATPIAVAVGTDGKVLTAKASETSGVSWETPSAGVAGLITKFIAGNLYVANTNTNFIHLIYFPTAVTLTNIKCGCATAPTGADVKMIFFYHASDPSSATTIYTTGPETNAPTIAASAKESGASNVPDVTSMAAGSFLVVGLSTVGSTIAGADLSYSISYS